MISEKDFIANLQQGLDPFSFHEGKTWLFEAISRGWVKASQLLLEKGVSARTRSQGKPALFALLHLQDPLLMDTLIRLLREYKTNFYELNPESISILDQASQQNHVVLLKRLLEEKDYDYKDIRRATLLACESLSVEALELLLNDFRTDFKKEVPREIKCIQFKNFWKAAQKKSTNTKQREAVLKLLAQFNPTNEMYSCDLLENPGHGYFVKRVFKHHLDKPLNPDHFKGKKMSKWSHMRYLSQWIESYDFSRHTDDSKYQSQEKQIAHFKEKEHLNRLYLSLFSEGRLGVIKRLAKRGVTPQNKSRSGFEYALRNRHYKVVHWMKEEGWISVDFLNNYLKMPEYEKAKIELEKLNLQLKMPKRSEESPLKSRL